MQFQETRFSGAYIINPMVIDDERGQMLRTFCIADFARKRLNAAFIQHFTSIIPTKGSIHGLTYTKPPHSMIRIVDCQAGAICSVIVDLRPGSRTYGEWQSLELKARSRRQLYVPDGIAFGLQTLVDDSAVGYLNSEFHAPDGVRGIRYDDPAFGIAWPLPVSEVLARDLRWPLFRRGNGR